MTDAATTRFWVGASTLGVLGGAARGIRPLDVDADGATRLGVPVEVGPNPMYLAWRDHEVFGIAHELQSGRVSTWRIDADAPDRPVRFGAEGAAGGDPCHLAFDETGEWILAANYSGGSITAHPVADGLAADAAFTVPFTGSGPNAERQEGPHPHQVVIDAARGRLLGPDLGADRIRTVPLSDISTSTSTSTSAGPDLRLHAGGGPRHLVIDGDAAIVANELDRTLSIVDLTIDAEVSVARLGDDVAPRGFGASGIRMTRTGVVLVGDRDADALRAFAFDRGTRTLTPIATVVTGGRHPRDLQLTHDERHVLVADQGSDSIAVIALDESGVPTRVVRTVATEAPACLARMPRAEH